MTSESSRNRSELLLAEQRLRALMDALPVGVSFSDDATCERITGNPAVLAQFEVTREDNLSASTSDDSAPGRQVRFLQDGKVIQSSELPLQRATAENQEIGPVEYEVQLPSGRRWFAHCYGAPIRDAQGEVVGGVAVTLDISARKALEAELQEREQRFRALAESLPQLIWVTDHEGRNTYCNQRFLEYTGTAADNMMGMAWQQIVHPDDLAPAARRWKNSVATGEPYLNQYRLRRGDGQYRYFLARAVPVRNERGEIVQWLGSSTDIHDQKLAEELMRRSEKLAVAAQLAASVAHEINNPLAAVMNCLYLAMQEEGLGEAARSHLKVAEQELARVAHVTAQALQFNKDSGTPSAVDVSKVMESVIALFAPRFKASSISIECDYRTQDKVYGDGDALRQAFANLIRNSLDATSRGGSVKIRVRSTVFRGGMAKRGLRVLVADTGCGIPPEIKGRLFEPFVSTKQATGTGLGLWLTESIVRQHNGHIAVRSRAGRVRHGTVFSLFLPLEGMANSELDLKVDAQSAKPATALSDAATTT